MDIYSFKFKCSKTPQPQSNKKMGKFCQVLFFALLAAINLAILVRHINSPCGTATPFMKAVINAKMNEFNATLSAPAAANDTVHNIAAKSFDALFVDTDLTILIGLTTGLTLLATVTRVFCA